MRVTIDCPVCEVAQVEGEWDMDNAELELDSGDCMCALSDLVDRSAYDKACALRAMKEAGKLQVA